LFAAVSPPGAGKKKKKSFVNPRELEIMKSVVDLLTPPPVSPLFQFGGILYGFNEDLFWICSTLGMLGLVDVLRRFTPFSQSSSRYFVLHAFTNALISMMCLPDLKRAFLSPLDALVGPTLTAFPMAAAVSIHIYHALFFKLSWDDIFHHLQFVLPLYPLSVMFKWDGGASQNFGAFFICGLPGGLNYAALACVKEGFITSLTQKRFDAWINACMRGPGCIAYAILQWQVWLSDARPSKGWNRSTVNFFTFLVTFLMVFNGIYYMEQSIGNYHAFKVKEFVKEKVGDVKFETIFPPKQNKAATSKKE